MANKSKKRRKIRQKSGKVKTAKSNRKTSNSKQKNKTSGQAGKVNNPTNQNRTAHNDKKGVIQKLVVALRNVSNKKRKNEEKYADYNVGQIRPVNNKETRGHMGYTITKSGEGANAEIGYVSITHQTKTNRKRNVKLSQNPNPNDPKVSHAVNKAKYAKAREIGKQQKGWRFNKRDKKTLKNIFNANKNK